MAWAAVRYKVVVLLLLTCCLLLLSLWDSVIFLCFVVYFSMSLLVCNHLDGEERAGVRCLTGAFCSALWHFAMQRYVTIKRFVPLQNYS